MSDQTVQVHGVPHLYQFQSGRSAYRCEAFSLAALSGFAYPYRHHWYGLANEPAEVSSLSDLASLIYQKYAGPDVVSNQQGMTKAQALEWFHLNSIGIYDLQFVLERGDPEELRRHMGAMNKCNIPILLGINDESHLYQATQEQDGNWVRGPKMHNWNDHGLHHALIRVGMDMVHPITLMNDPATACPPFQYPTPVLWDDLKACGINTAIGIMPPGIAAPPADFRFHTDDGVDHAWPIPAPTIDTETPAQILQAMRSKFAVLEHDAGQLQIDIDTALKALGK